ncbi:MAG: hypothetical protein ACJA2C_001095 [Marinoscillum sp.]|jgi:hypothetical protein
MLFLGKDKINEKQSAILLNWGYCDEWVLRKMFTAEE